MFEFAAVDSDPAMTSHEPDLDHLTSLLGRCLGRIDEQAYRIQQDGDETTDFGAADVLEEEAATLQELIGTMLVAAGEEREANVNSTLERAVQAFLNEIDVPILVRQRLAADLPRIACAPGELAFAVQRALVLTADTLAPGAELIVTRGAEAPDGITSRAETLREFATHLGGACHVQAGERDGLLVALELPLSCV
jgi:hypothetical protein